MDGNTNIERVLQRVGRGMEQTAVVHNEQLDREKPRTILGHNGPDAAMADYQERMNRIMMDAASLPDALHELRLLRLVVIALLLEQGGKAELPDYAVLEHKHTLRVTRSPDGFSLRLEAVPETKPKPQTETEGTGNVNG